MVGEGVVALAARRASSTYLEGATRDDDEDMDARTGASIRGSSMAGVGLAVVVPLVSRLFEVRRSLARLGGVCSFRELSPHFLSSHKTWRFARHQH